MKTKEQIVKHLEEYGYTPMALCKILGFMIGAGLKAEDEKVVVKTNDLKYNWDDFWFWLNDEKKGNCTSCPLCDMLNELINTMENADDPAEVQKAHERYEFLIESFWLDE